MAGTGLPIPKNDAVLPQPANVIGAGAYSNAQSWLNIAQSSREEADAAARAGAAEVGTANQIGALGATLAGDAQTVIRTEMHQQHIAQIADFEVNWRDKRVKARDEFSNDPEGFKKWSDASMEGAVAQVPGWMAPHAKRFLSHEFEGAYGAILGETRARDKAIAGESLIARTKMADDDVMSIASATGSLNSVEGKAALVTHQAILDSAVTSGLMSRDKAQLLTEDLTTRAEGSIIRNSVEKVYRAQGFEAARAHLDQELSTFGAPYRVTDKVRQQTLGWLRSEEAGLRGERDAIGKEWAAAKPSLATLDPSVLQDIQNRAYAVGNMKVGDDIQAHVSALSIVKNLRQLPQADQVRVLASGNIDARLAQRESGGKPDTVNQFGYAGTYQFGAPRLKDLGVYTPGDGENLAGWSKTPATAPGKWTGTFNIPGFPDVKTMQDFLGSPNAQKAVYELHQQRTDQEIGNLGLGQYIGQTIGGVQLTQDGLRAMVHLAGAAGTQRVLQSGGQYNPPDANGTTALDYARLGDPNAAPGAITGSRAGLLALGLLKKDMTQDLTKKIADLRTAIDKTEFPPMDEIGALGAQVHLLGNEEQKRQVAEMAGQAEYGAKFMTLPQAQRDEITARWREKLKNGATAYERHLADTVQTANQRVTDAWQKDPYDAAARYSEGVTALPAIDWQSNTAPQVLAAKVAQQNTIRADQNMGAFSVLRPGESQSLAATLVNGDPKQGSQILRTLADTLPPDIYRATVSDAPVKAALDGMVRSYDPDRLNTAFSVLDRAYRADPVGFKATFGDTTMGRLQTWQAHKDSLSPMQMSEYFKRADDPAFATARKALEEEAEKKISGNTPEKVSNLLGSFADRNVPFVNQAPPTDPLSAGALVAEYDKLFKERFVDTRDEGKSRDQAVERLKTTWGQSAVAGGALMKYPPERFYPQVDGSYDWMKRDLDAAVGASRLGGVTNTVTAPGLTPDIPGAPSSVDVPAFSYRLLSDGRTEADVAGKRPPSYVVMVKDLATGRENIPLDWAGKPMRYSFDPANAQERSVHHEPAPDPFAGQSNMPGASGSTQSVNRAAPDDQTSKTAVIWTRRYQELSLRLAEKGARVLTPK
jgi:hypothetical protein